MKDTTEKQPLELRHLANWVVRIIGGAIMIFLCYYAMRYTQYMHLAEWEKPLNVHDSMTRNLLAVALAVGMAATFRWLEKRLSPRLQERVCLVAMLVATAWMFLFGMAWFLSADRQPVGDQAFIYGGASYFMEGSYFFLHPGNYFGLHPYQQGLAAVVELVLRIAGPYNYKVLQLLNVFFSAGSVAFGYGVVTQITRRFTARLLYSVFMTGCMPLAFYVSWVYGDMPSIFFALVGIYMLLKYRENKKWSSLAGMIAALTMAMLVRQNSLIVLLAILCVSLVYCITNKDKKLLLALTLSCLIPFLLYQGIYKINEIRSGYEHSGGVPNIAQISMGMQEVYGKYGWYTTYASDIYLQNELDPEVTSQLAKADIKERIRTFLDNPSYAWMFYREKVLSQWNAPLYQSLFFSKETMAHLLGDEEAAQENALEEKITGDWFVPILNWNDMLQFVIFVGTLCYFLFFINKDVDTLELVLAVAMIGGFLFSILWEAKSRYILPYYVMMFPQAAIGYERLIAAALRLTQRKAKGSKVVDIEDYRKTA